MPVGLARYLPHIIGLAVVLSLMWWLYATGYDNGYRKCEDAAREATERLNGRIRTLDEDLRRIAVTLQQTERENRDLEQRLAAERAASNDTSAWSLERVRRYNRAGPR